MRIDARTRRGFKKAAKINLRKHYFAFILMCLFAALIGSEFVTSENLFGVRTDPVSIMLNGYEEAVVETETEARNETVEDSIDDSLVGVWTYEDSEASRVYTFNDDGTGDLTITSGDSVISWEFTYSVDGENIVIRRDGHEDEVTDYVVGDDTLSLGFEGVEFTRSGIK